jgi:hypothetical protein
MKLNMTKLKVSRKKPNPGDIFIFKIATEDHYRFGRVIRTEATIGGFEDVILIYIYYLTSSSKKIIPELDINHLLVPPIGTNRQGWLKGYFETVSYRPLDKEQLLPQHHFLDFTGKYFDDNAQEVKLPVEPIGEWGIHSLGTIDNAISDALGIPWAEEPSEDLLRALEGKPNLHRK